MVSITSPRPQVALKESYSLWFVPKGSLAAHLHREIVDTSRKTEAPEFFPHVTLLGGIAQPKEQVLTIAEQIASSLKPIQIEFDKVTYGNIYHQCVYILCKASEDLSRAGRAAKEAFNLDPSTPYMPHLSLIYSDMSSSDRQALAAELQQKLFSSTSRESGDDSDGEKFEENGFLADSLAVWYTPAEDKSLESWRAVSVFPLQ
ncbi:putative Cyclic phosphodiesterase [Nannochloris sp. 'desiccata']|nr:putative Cyclic phosphodiesterase [Chlorella desiccata (nom. nud.)]